MEQKDFSNLELAFLKKSQLCKIKGLIDGYKFNDYRNYGFFSKELLNKYFFKQFQDLFSKYKNTKILIAANNGKIFGLCSLVPLGWDSKYFGFKMQQIQHLISPDPYQYAVKVKELLLSEVMALCKREKVRHIACKVDVEDFSSIHCLESNGFKTMGVYLTYIMNLTKCNVPVFKDRFKTRFSKKGDLRALLDLTKQHHLHYRFQVDPSIPLEKSQGFYAQWIQNTYRGSFGNKVLIVASGKKIAGFLAYHTDKEFKKYTGVRLLNKGLIMVAPEARGALLSLLKAMAQNRQFLKTTTLAEFDISIHNYSLIKVFQRLGFSLVKAQFCFHKEINH